MININHALKFLEHFSIITVAENKVPNYPWKQYQTEKISEEKFIKQYNYKGGTFKKDSTEIPATDNFGIVCGFEDLEVIDIDLKVFSTAQEQREFWDEFLGMLKDNIYEFDEKFVIYKTKNAGYHILYKTKRVEGNLKIAKLKGHTEAIIETRGNGGYVFAYPENKVSTLSYFDIQYITDLDREIIFDVCKTYNFVEEQEITSIDLNKKTENKYSDSEISPWDDYNKKTNIFDIISSDFDVVKNCKDHILIKRHGATSSHSGYVYKNSGCMYLFSTGSIYPHQKLITPFGAYSWKYHNGDYKRAIFELYNKGFGSRAKQVIKEISEKIVVNNDLLEDFKIRKTPVTFPVDIFPDSIQSYLLECNNKLDANLDYMGVSLIWLTSVCIGNLFKIEVKKGWIEHPAVWMVVVGKAGIGKTPSVKNITSPLSKVNSREIKKYIQELRRYEEYMELSKKEREQYPEIKKPTKKQFIANDITLEALVELHEDRDNGVGVFKDELAGWFKDMNKYRAGSDLEFWLSTWSGESVNINRLTRAGSFVESPFIPVLGGIQPDILNSFFTEENKDNGFVDRMLLSYPEADVPYFNEDEIDPNLLLWYKESVINMFDSLNDIAEKSRDNDEERNIVPHICYFSADAKKEWVRIFNSITDIQNSEDESEYIKSMYPKLKSYIPRFALIIHILDSFFNDDGIVLEVQKSSVIKAEMLANYFIGNSKNVKINSKEVNEIRRISSKKETTYEKIISLYENDKDFNRTKVAEMLGVSRQSVMKYIKQIEAKNTKV